jgi:cytochrome c oxidase subunit 1
MNDTLGRIHFVLTFIFFNLVFWPMHELGTMGMMRRIYDPTQYQHIQPLQDTNQFISICAFVLGASQLIFAFNFIWSLAKGRKAEINPWQANSLEWTAPSPPPHGNWGDRTPTVYRGPYEYASPEVAGDYYPQTQPPPSGQAAPVSSHY